MDKDQNDNENGGVPIRKLFVANIPSNVSVGCIISEIFRN